jgi:hypothetical protein
MNHTVIRSRLVGARFFLAINCVFSDGFDNKTNLFFRYYEESRRGGTERERDREIECVVCDGETARE